MSKKLKLLISFISVFLVFSVIACSVFVIVDIKKNIDDNSSSSSENFENESSYFESISSEISSGIAEESSSVSEPESEPETESKPPESSSKPEQETPPPHTHTYSVEKTVKPTCTEDGYTVYKCSCGESYKTNGTAALGHSWGEWKTTKEPTTAAEGEKQRNCTRCGEKEIKSIEKLPKPESPPVNPNESYMYILGTSVFSAEDLVNYVLRYKSRDELKLNCTIEELAGYYISEGAAEGIRGDIAFCQAIWETGWFTFGGSVQPDRNNYCGLGAIDDTAGGEKFATPQIGVRAHIQHLKAYASTATKEDLAFSCVDTRFDYAKDKVLQDGIGIARTWVDLGGRWAQPGYDKDKYASLEAAIAAGDSYGHKILSKYKQLAGIS